LDHCGHDPRGLVIEVYDHPQPPSGIDVSPIEMLAARDCVISAMVGMGDGAEDQFVLVYELRTTQGQVQTGAGVEDDKASVGIGRAWIVLSHRDRLRAASRSWSENQWSCPEALAARFARFSIATARAYARRPVWSSSSPATSTYKESAGAAQRRVGACLPTVCARAAGDAAQALRLLACWRKIPLSGCGPSLGCSQTAGYLYVGLVDISLNIR
jgi:hypothetical protein